MKIAEYIEKKYVSKEESDKLNEIVDKLPNNNELCKDILLMLGNEKTVMKSDENINGNYYVFLNDTIYIKDNKKFTNSNQRLCVISHECRHSIQSKVIQILNFLFANIELLGFLLVLCSIIFNFESNYIYYGYIVSNLLSVTIRLFLEMDATMFSVTISKKYLDLDKYSYISNEDKIYLIDRYSNQMKKLLPLFIFTLIAGKLAKLIFTIVMLIL